MLHAAAMVVLFCSLWLLWTLQWQSWDQVAVGLIAALISIAFGLRAAPASVAVSQAPKKVSAWLDKFQPATAGVLDLVRVVLGASPRPALLQLKRRGEGASLAMHWGAMPGVVHVESDEESFLFHVMTEEKHEAMMLRDIQRGSRR